MSANPYISKEKDELYDGLIIGAIRGAACDYEEGAIVECRDRLADIVWALDEFIKGA